MTRSVRLLCRYLTRAYRLQSITAASNFTHAARAHGHRNHISMGRLPESSHFRQQWRVRRLRKSCCGHSKVCTVVSEVHEKFEVESLGEAIRESVTSGQRRAARTPTVARAPSIRSPTHDTQRRGGASIDELHAGGAVTSDRLVPHVVVG